MRGKKDVFVFLFAIVLVCASIFAVEAAPRLTLDPLRSTGREGKTIRLNVRVDDVVDCFAWQFEMFWDSDILELDNYYTVPFLSRHEYYESHPSAYDSMVLYETSPTAHTNSSDFQFKTDASVTPGTPFALVVDGYGSERTGWVGDGASPYLNAKNDGNEVISDVPDSEMGDFTFADRAAGGSDVLKTVTLSVYAGRIGNKDEGSYVEIYVYDGASWSLVGTIYPVSTTYSDFTLTVTSTLNTWAKLNAAEIYLKYKDLAPNKVHPIVVDEAHLDVTYDIVAQIPADPTRAYDDTLTTEVGFTTNQTGYFELSGQSTLSYPYTIDRVDVKMHYNYSSLNPSPDKYRIIYYVGSTGPEVVQDWTNASYGVEPPFPGMLWSPATRLLRDLYEPKDGVWNWTDVSNMRLRIETQQNGNTYSENLDLYEVWAEVYRLSVSATDPEKAYDENDATCASFKYDVDGNFSVLTFDKPIYEYDIDNVEFNMRYSAEGGGDDRYRIVYTVDPEGDTDVRILQDWTTAASSLATHTWADQGEPNDGVWSWIDIAKINMKVEADLVSSSDDLSFSLYEAWVTIEYHRSSFGADTVESGYLFLGYTIAAEGVDGVGGSQNLLVCWFNVLSAGSTHPIILQRIKLLDQYGGKIIYGPVVSVNGFENGAVGWSRTGVSPYLHLKDDGNYTYTDAGDTTGNFTFEDQSGLAGGTALNKAEVSVYAKQSTGGNDTIEVHVWDGATWTLADTIVPTETYTSYVYDVSSILDTWDKIDYAKIKFKHNINGTADTVYVDQAALLMNRFHSYYISAWAEDIDMDGYVDIMDLCLIGINFGKTGDPGWIDEDVVKDGVIDIEDLVAVALKFSAGSYL